MQLQKKVSWSKAVDTLKHYCVPGYVQNRLPFLSFILIATITLFPFPILAVEPQVESQKEPQKELEGFKFGVGLTLTIDAGGLNRVQEAEVVNGIVRITEERDVIPRLMLETHYFFVPKKTSFLGILDATKWGWGPFVGLQNGSDDIIEAIGIGLMIGFRRREDPAQSFNIGLGAIVDPSVKVLGDGIRQDEPLPAGETNIRYKHTDQWGFLIITSYSF